MQPLKIAVVALALAGCGGSAIGASGALTAGHTATGHPAAGHSTAGRPDTGASGAARPSAEAAEQICLRAFGQARLIEWAEGTVASFRSFQYGGPRPVRPLARVFPSLAGTTRGAWCGTRQAAQTTRWWAVVPGYPGARAIDITGPGEGIKRGYIPTGPVVP